MQDFLVPRKIRFHVLGRNNELTNQFQQQLDICIQSHDYSDYSTDQTWKLLHNSILLSGELTFGCTNAFDNIQSAMTFRIKKLHKKRNKLRKKLQKPNLSFTIKRIYKSQLNSINNKLKNEVKQRDRDNFQSYLDKLSDAPSSVYFELCRLKNKDKKSNNHLKCDLLKTKAYYKEHFHDHPSNLEPIQHCVTREEYDCVNEMFIPYLIMSNMLLIQSMHTRHSKHSSI